MASEREIEAMAWEVGRALWPNDEEWRRDAIKKARAESIARAAITAAEAVREKEGALLLDSYEKLIRLYDAVTDRETSLCALLAKAKEALHAFARISDNTVSQHPAYYSEQQVKQARIVVAEMEKALA